MLSTIFIVTINNTLQRTNPNSSIAATTAIIITTTKIVAPTIAITLMVTAITTIVAVVTTIVDSIKMAAHEEINQNKSIKNNFFCYLCYSVNVKHIYWATK